MTDGTSAAEAVSAEIVWKRLVEKGLRGRPYSDLVARAAEGFPIEPIQPAAAPSMSGRAAGAWRRFQRIDHSDAERSAALALEALNSGADGIVLTMRSAPGARGFGIVPDDLSWILRDIRIDACALRIEAGADGLDIAGRVIAEAERRRIDPPLLDIAFGLDPLSPMAASGTGLSIWDRTLSDIAAFVSRRALDGYRGPFLAADGRRAHEAGADAASELAFVIAAMVAYLRLLAQAGIEAPVAASAIEAVLVADSDQYLSIAKFRAARWLIRRVRSVCGLPAAPIRLHGETSYRMMTRLDPHSNLVRAAIAAFSAGVGGADSIAVLPFTAPFGLASDTARRLALDTQSVLLEEANIFRVADPSAGSGSIEALTLNLAHEAWRRFQAIEAEGGIVSSLASGSLQRRIAAEREIRQAAIADGSIAILGTNLHRASGIPAAEVDAPFPTPAASVATEFPPLPSLRASEAAESEAA